MPPSPWLIIEEGYGSHIGPHRIGVASGFCERFPCCIEQGDYMTDSKSRGNNPELWQKLLEDLDEKLQLGLLDRLRRVAAYHFESDILFIEPANPEDATYLTKGATFQQLELLAQDATNIREIRVCSKGTFPKEC